MRILGASVRFNEIESASFSVFTESLCQGVNIFPNEIGLTNLDTPPRIFKVMSLLILTIMMMMALRGDSIST